MKLQPFSLYLFAILLAFSACQDAGISPDLISGTYSGVFQLSDVSTGMTNSGEVELNLSAESFTCSENPNRLPAGGAGSFRQKDDVIEFEDQHVWPPHFDMHLVLTGTFSYQLDGASLHLWKETGNTRYEYLLEKQ